MSIVHQLPGLSKQQQARVLAVLHAGGHVESRRIVPYPHRYYVVGEDGRTGVELEEGTVRAMVDRKWVQPKPVDATWDTIAYRPTRSLPAAVR